MKDAEKVTEIKPDWAKGWGRKGAAMHGVGDLLGAHDAYEEGLKLDPNNAQNKSGLAAVNRAIDAEAKADGVTGNPTEGLGNMFKDPQLMQKLAGNPKTAPFLADPQFMQRLQQIQNAPAMSQDIFSDPRMIQVLGVLMGVDMDMMGGAGAAGQAGPNAGEREEDVEMPDARPTQEKAEPVKEPTPEPDADDEEAKGKKAAKEEADKEKALGTAEYKKRNFDDAIAHYQKAWELYKDITYKNNEGAAKYEKGDYEGAIAACQEAIEVGREIYADFKMIAKSYARIGSSYEKMGNFDEAISHFKKALTEHRTPDIVNKLRACEKTKIDAARNAYIDPEEAEKARELGNAKFKEMDWPGAVAAYTEMIKRAPEDPRGYSNRAAAFIKLLEFPSALDDCDAAIKKDKKFVRAYLRKAQAYFGMREYSKCVDVCEEATAVDEGAKNKREIETQQQKALSAMYAARENETEEQTKERIQRDPEVCLVFDCGCKDKANLKTDYVDHAGSSHELHLAAGTGRPICSPGAHEEPSHQEQDPEADRFGRHPCWPLSS